MFLPRVDVNGVFTLLGRPKLESFPGRCGGLGYGRRCYWADLAFARMQVIWSTKR